MAINCTGSRPGLPAGFPFSLGCDANGTYFISGMPALDPDGKFVPGTFAEEADLAWHNVIAIAEASGYSCDEVVYVQCVLSDMADYGSLNDWWRRRFPDVSGPPGTVHVPGRRSSVRCEDRDPGGGRTWQLRLQEQRNRT